MRTIFALLLIVASLPAAAFGNAPTDFGKYDAYRADLIALGWKPVPFSISHHIDGLDGLPEVLCGNGSCSAQWQAPDGRDVDYNLWLNETGELVISPEAE